MNDTEHKNENSINILIVDDEDTILDILSTGFKKRGMRPFIAKESDSAISILKKNPIHFSLIDVRLPGKSGIDLCNEILSISPKTFNIIMTGYPGVKSAVEAMKNNAHDYLIKPFRIELVLDVINRAFEESMIETENDILVQSLREENKKLRDAEEEWLKLHTSEIENTQRPAGMRAVALLNLIWFEDTQFREKSAVPQKLFAELFHESKLRDSFSEDQIDYLVNHSHFDLGMITPDDQAELVKEIRSKFDDLMQLSSPKTSLPEIDKLNWHLITIEILKNVMLFRREREGKPRVDFMGLAIDIVSDLRERH